MDEKPFNKNLDLSESIREAKSHLKRFIPQISRKLDPTRTYSLEELGRIFDYRPEPKWGLEDFLLNKKGENPNTQWEADESGRFRLIGIVEKQQESKELTDLEKSRLAEMRQKITEESFKAEIVQQRLALTWVITSHLIKSLVKAGELIRIGVGAGITYEFPKREDKQTK